MPRQVRKTNYSRRITSIADQLNMLYADMFDEDFGDVSEDDETAMFVQNLEDTVYEIDQALDEFRRQIVLEKGEEDA
jgi:hypothetical protein